MADRRNMQGVSAHVGRMPKRTDAQIAAARRLNADAVYGVGAEIIARVSYCEGAGFQGPHLYGRIEPAVT